MTSSHGVRLPAVAERLADNPGPIVISAKGHSGTRFIAEALECAGVFMGADMNAAFDSMSWHDDFAVPIMNSSWFPEMPLDDPTFAALCSERFGATLNRYVSAESISGPWGWKGSTLFVTPLVTAAFPDTRLLHIIRDGRDVALSEDGQLNLPFQFPLNRRHPVKLARQIFDGFAGRKSRDDYRMKIFFGRSDIDTWNDIDLTRQSVYANRYLLQMQSWIRNVTEARRYGEELGKNYLEIRYEELCQQPEAIIGTVLEWLEIPRSDAVISFVNRAAYTGSIAKWRTLDLTPERRADFDRACAHGEELLTTLGYELE